MRRRPDGEQRFTQLYRDNSQDILAFLLRRCPTAEEAADCLAETFEVAWAKRDRIPAGDRARPWLFVIARNMMRRSHEREARTTNTTQEIAAALRSSGVDAGDPSDERSRRESEVLAALATLPALDQEILTLTVWDQLTPTEVAVALNLSSNVVRVRAHRARAKLRAALSTRQESPRARAGPHPKAAVPPETDSRPSTAGQEDARSRAPDGTCPTAS